ncbi:MAG: type II toxin-antitoxin system VapC family toxin [Deltaproteobacteria bacterium]|nr:MAG: type II toxin-antitoxin system VapC family toxin [Deltaproteobacteria bacterium]TMB33930.1 MAG: type II toxin-antitoxin system VapC family toxin [Deltaproteobacteria bacterium]
MIALDTNVLVRFLVEDDKAQSARAARLVARAIEADEPLFIPDVVICETVWVLLAAYQVPRLQVGETLGRLLMAAHLRFQDVDRLSRALQAFLAGKGDFADYVIREEARAAGCDRVATFDRVLLRESAFIAP